MANKVRYGLSNCKYSIYDPDTDTYAAPVAMPGAVSLSITREGGDSSDFWADDGVYHTFPGSNGGYSGDLEMARITPAERSALLGEVYDQTKKMYSEVTDPGDIQFALICEYKGDRQPMAQVFYNCKASRIETNANTMNDSPSVDTDTLHIRMAAQEFSIGGEKVGYVQSHMEKENANATEYAAFLASVQLPSGVDES